MFDCDNMKNIKISRRYINDFILLAAILLIAFALIVYREIRTETADKVLVTYNAADISTKGTSEQQFILDIGKPGYYIISINSNVDNNEAKCSDVYSEYESVMRDIVGLNSYNVIHVSEDDISVVAASCPDLICVHTAEISHNGGNIICLPNRLIVTTEKKTEGPDAVTY